MPSARLTLREEDVVRLALEFLHNRELHITQLSLERETGVINGNYSDDVLFLRQLILDGQWDDVLEFIQPLEALSTFNMRKFSYSILKHKYIELLCIKSEANVQGSNVDNAVEEVVKVLNELEKFAPTKEDYSNLCLLLTLPRLTDHLHYKDWNPSNARVQCFRDVYPLVADFLVGDRKTDQNSNLCSKNDRLIQLIIKGILYESCVNYCQTKATGVSDQVQNEISFAKLLDGSVGFSDSDLSLLSWLQSVPPETFSVPFEQRTLNVDVERLDRPSLETSWTEHMLVTPIKPKTFPHSAMPFTRPRSAADIMSRSLMPVLDGLPYGLTQQNSNGGGGGGAVNGNTRIDNINTNGQMSRSSFASFHLTGMKNAKSMNASVDRVSENEGDVFLGNSYAEFQQLPSIQEQTSTPKAETAPTTITIDKRANTPERKVSNASTPDHKGRESPASTGGTARSSRRDSLNERPTQQVADGQGCSVPSEPTVERSFTGDLFKEFQKQKQKFQETMAIKEREREELLKQINNNGEKSDSQQDLSRLGKGREPPASRRMPRNEPKSIEEELFYIKPNTQYDTDLFFNGPKEQFVKVTTLEDVQAIRCAEFHPSGHFYAVGSNSKTLRICSYPNVEDLRSNHQSYQPTVLYKRTKHHKGSIYSLAWSPAGDLLATGSNDKSIKVMRFNPETANLEGEELELTMHDGTVRDVCFMEDTSNMASLLLSAGAGNYKIYVTDCATGTPLQTMSGHTAAVQCLYTWGGAVFASGSHDRTIRFWDLRTRGCVNLILPSPQMINGSGVSSICVDPTERLLVAGHDDSLCSLLDIRTTTILSTIRAFKEDVRSVRFSPSIYYLLAASYDGTVVLADLQGNLREPAPYVLVASHKDKVISARWHPKEFTFITTSADKTCSLWALPMA